MTPAIVAPPNLVTLAKIRATMAGVDPILCCAVCEQESEWNPWAIRCEPGFYSRYVEKLPNLGPTEAWARAFSWGLLQLMGEVAREEGYIGKMAMLCDPQTGLDRGLIHLKKQLIRANGDKQAALQFWNGGGNPQYATEVLARVGKYL